MAPTSNPHRHAGSTIWKPQIKKSAFAYSTEGPYPPKSTRTHASLRGALSLGFFGWLPGSSQSAAVSVAALYLKLLPRRTAGGAPVSDTAQDVMASAHGDTTWQHRRMAALSVLALVTPARALDTDIESMLSTMSLADKVALRSPTLLLPSHLPTKQVGQMTQINIDKFVHCDSTTSTITMDRTALKGWLQDWRIGSLLNSPYAGNGLTCGDYGWNASDWRSAIRTIQVSPIGMLREHG